MKGRRLFGTAVAVALVLALLAGLTLAQAPAGSPAGTAFTYQGRLEKDGSPVDGICDLRFELWDALDDGAQVGSTLTRSGVGVSDGFFTVADLDFGAQFTGEARWLEVAVKCAGDPDYNWLSPRQALTAAPVALSLALPFRAEGASDGALVSLANSGTGQGLLVDSAGSDGIYVGSAGSPSSVVPDVYSTNGVEVAGAEDAGLYIGRADGAGVWVDSAGAGVFVYVADYDGVYVERAGYDGVHVEGTDYDGVRVEAAGQDGLVVDSAGDDGLEVWSAADDGMCVWSAGEYGVYVGSAGYDGVYVDSAGFDGMRVASAVNDGMVVDSALNDGVAVWSAGADGVYVGSAGYDGVYVDSAGRDGLRVDSASADGVYVYSAGYHGVEVISSGYHGVHVDSAGLDGVHANTEQASHEWGIYTPDKIYAGSALTASGPSMIVAQNGDGGPLQPGDVVAVSGAGAPFAESDFPAPLVRRASPEGGAIAGVVYARFVAEEEVEEVEQDGQIEQRTHLHSRSAEGPAAPGDYLLLVVLGPAQVRASAAAGAIAAGDLLVAAGEGQAARLGDAYRPGSLLGTAMEPLDGTQGSGLIWVLVNPR